MSTPTNFTTPTGRLVQGSLYKGSTTDANGKPRVVKTGPNAGQPSIQYYFALAIPKGAEQHWSQTPWGAAIWRIGHEGFPNGAAQSPTFAWKIKDGDSTIPNSAGKKPCEQEGFPGHWIVGFASGFPPKIYGDGGNTVFTEPDRVKLGHYVQVNGNVASNGEVQKPGVYINHSMVCFVAFGAEISTGPDPRAAGFTTGGPLPAGASLAPPPGAFNPALPGVPPAPLVQNGSVPMPYVPAASVPVPGVPAIPVVPNPAYLAVPGIPPALARVMLPKAGGHTYETLVSQGWNDVLLVQHGMMAA